MLKIQSRMFEESKKSTASENIIVNIIIFIIVFIIIALAEAAIPSMLSNAELKQLYINEGLIEKRDMKRMMEISTELNMKPKYFIPTLLCTGFGTLISIIYCRFIEARYIRSMGVRKENAVFHYIQGFCVGLALMTSIVVLPVSFGISSISICQDINYELISLYFLGFFVQGMSEEFIFRGYLMTTIGARHNPVTAIAVSAVAFSLAHFANPGFNVLAFFNLALFGVFASLYMIYFGDIWGVCAIHSIWNFTQGNFYGISVSGSGITESVFRTTANTSSVILTGGDFGIEGSIVTTIVLGAGTAIILYKMSKQKADN